MNADEVRRALEPVLPALESDGTALTIERADDEEVVIRIEQGGEACADCVMTPDNLHGIIAECLAQAGLKPTRLAVK